MQIIYLKKHKKQTNRKPLYIPASVWYLELNSQINSNWALQWHIIWILSGKGQKKDWSSLPCPWVAKWKYLSFCQLHRYCVAWNVINFSLKYWSQTQNSRLGHHEAYFSGIHCTSLRNCIRGTSTDNTVLQNLLKVEIWWDCI